MLTPTITAAVAKSKDNLCSKLELAKYYKCGEPGHKSNDCPKRRQVNKANYEEEDDMLIETELEYSDFIERHGDPVAYVIQKVLCSQKIPDTT